MKIAFDRSRSERAIVLQLLRDDHGELWSHRELRAELNIALATLVESLEDLQRHGVVVKPDEDRVRASPCTRRLDALELISI
jgi:DNA-binding HxlR family transcriptional regulator